ncbi:hypothetical protein KD146_03360 [Devosia sp. BSSL-BM10]|uniref:Uncharacterized protein n=1 Tax=Devosia litorisediminis TaxID=2829817 RepID=A0A942EAD8_9HYPH|nr:hypothetical protein [Devosia litorisediminis]MBS3847729.1 hypothetical protein [Devosia litorisediminis]
MLRFEAAVATSKVVISRPLGIIQGLIDDTRQSYVSFQKQVSAGLRSPADNIYDQVRQQYESALYPHFSGEIIFGSLTLSGRGITPYGPYAMVLRTEMIKRRTTVFEENPHKFISKHRLLGNEPLSAGYRADWEGRSRLAATKLQPDLTPNTSEEDFPGILQKDVGDTGEGDFIEAHIYGSINRNAIESVVGPKPKVRADRIIWDAVVQRLNNAGIEARTI